MSNQQPVNLRLLADENSLGEPVYEFLPAIQLDTDIYQLLNSPAIALGVASRVIAKSSASSIDCTW